MSERLTTTDHLSDSTPAERLADIAAADRAAVMALPTYPRTYGAGDDPCSGLVGRFDRYTGRTTYHLVRGPARSSNLLECAELGPRAASEMFNHWGKYPEPSDLVLVSDAGPLVQRRRAERVR